MDSQNIKSSKQNHLAIFILILTVIAIWCISYNRLTLQAWFTPINYFGDGLQVLGLSRAHQNGEIFPVIFKFVSSLNAPFTANWNDSPITMEFIHAAIGWLAKITDLFFAANVVVLIAHILAALAFFMVCRIKNYETSFSFLGAIAFAFTTYIFYRNLPHVGLAFYWHIPLFILVTWRCASNKVVTGKFFIAALIISIITGLLNQYYTFVYLQFLGFVVLLHLARKQWANLSTPVIMIFITIASFLLMQLDTILYQLEHGGNSASVVRSLAGVEVYGLKLPELFLPLYHRIIAVQSFSQEVYYSNAYIRGEWGAAYLGIIGIAGFLWLFILSLTRFFQGNFKAIPMHFWQIVWVFMFSLVGGINLILGTIGLTVFRATNRYSIVILALCLLFLVRQLSKLSRHYTTRLSWFAAVCLIIISVLDLYADISSETSFNSNSINQVYTTIQLDKAVVQTLEAELAEGSMIFQLPVMDHPEGAIRVENQGLFYDYEHFRPFLYSNTLHYSYGTHKGRKSNLWQKEVAQLAPEAMINALENYGFSAILINRKGYEDLGLTLIRALTKADRPIINQPAQGDLIAIRLNPVANPSLPPTE